MEEIRISKLEKNFGAVRALKGLDLTVAPGELFFLLGASGCGKTTLLRCIAGLEKPNAGSIHFGGRDVTQLPPHKREAAMVFQSYALWPHLSVARNIAFGLEERKVPRSEIKRRVDEALEMVRLAGYGERAIDQMSGGQQQRVSLARALVVRPRCLLLDEPLSNLDPKLRVEMRREIRRIVKENALTAIYVTHDQEEALAMADRMAVLDQGIIAQVGRPEEIYRAPLNAYVAGFIGETNLFTGTLATEIGKQSRDIVEVVMANGTTFAGKAAATLAGAAVGTAVIVSVRPEAWKMSAADHVRAGSDAGLTNRISGTLAEHLYLGRSIQYQFVTPLGAVDAVETNAAAPRAADGGTLELRVSAQETVVLPAD